MNNMERLYEKVFAELERQRIEENKKFFMYENVGDILSRVYDFYEDSSDEEIIEITQYIWDRYVEHLKTIEPDLYVFDDMAGLSGWDEDDFDDEEEDEEDSPTELCDRIEEHITNLLDGEGDEVYDEYTTIALSEDKESVIVTRGIEQESETFKISDYKGLAYLVIAIYGFLYN